MVYENKDCVITTSKFTYHVTVSVHGNNLHDHTSTNIGTDQR